MVGAPGPEESALISARRARALQLRVAGVDNLTIGKLMAADPRINTHQISYPAGYGSDRYTRGDDPITDDDLVKRVGEDIQRAMRIRQAQMNEGADQLRAIQDARLERVVATLYPRAIEGDAGAIGQLLKYLERQAKLHGLDSPVKTELVDKDGESIQVVAVEKKREAAIEFLDTLAEGEERAIAAARAITEREQAEQAPAEGVETADDIPIGPSA